MFVRESSFNFNKLQTSRNKDVLFLAVHFRHKYNVFKPSINIQSLFIHIFVLKQIIIVNGIKS